MKMDIERSILIYQHKFQKDNFKHNLTLKYNNLAHMPDMSLLMYILYSEKNMVRKHH